VGGYWTQTLKSCVLVFVASGNDAVFWRVEAERLAGENEIL